METKHNVYQQQSYVIVLDNTCIPFTFILTSSGRKGQVAGPSVPEQQQQQQQQGVIGRSRPGSGKSGTGQSIALCQKVKVRLRSTSN